MSEWRERKLEELAEIIKNKYTPRTGDALNYIGLEHIQEQALRLNGIGSSEDVTSDKFYFRKGDILYGKLRPYFRKVIQPNFDGVCSTDIWVVRSKNGVNQTFLFYLFANKQFVDLSDSGEAGTKMPRADWKFMAQTSWNIPNDENEQRAIASVLSSLDDKIDLLHRQNKTLEAMAETLYRQLFVEEADEGWDVYAIGKMFEITSGKGLKKEQLNEFGLYPVLGANGEIGKTNNYLYDEKLIFTGRVGTLGNVFIIYNEKVWLSDNTLIIKPNKYFYSTYFILKSCKLDQYNVGSTQPLIRQSDIKKIEISFPPQNVMEYFENKVELLYQKIKLNNQEITTLNRFRDILLPRLMSGEVRVDYS